LRQTEDNYHQMTEDFNKVQKQLISATKREVDSQELLTIMVIRFYETDFIILKILIKHICKKLFILFRKKIIILRL